MMEIDDYILYWKDNVKLPFYREQDCDVVLSVPYIITNGLFVTEGELYVAIFWHSEAGCYVLEPVRITDEQDDVKYTPYTLIIPTDGYQYFRRHIFKTLGIRATRGVVDEEQYSKNEQLALDIIYTEMLN